MSAWRRAWNLLRPRWQTIAEDTRDWSIPYYNGTHYSRGMAVRQSLWMNSRRGLDERHIRWVVMDRFPYRGNRRD